MTATSDWFGNEFEKLHPKIQEIHLKGGMLSGDVDIYYGKGLAAIIGKRLGRKLGIPIATQSHLDVTIEHMGGELHWSRSFNDNKVFKSVFIPIGQKEAAGYWVEKTGSLQLYLTVDIQNKGWYWRPLKMVFKGITLPLFLLPKMTAYKRVESGKYKFHVNFSLMFVGTVLAYEGLLTFSPLVVKKSC